VLDLGSDMTITFSGVDMADLGESNFVFDQTPVTTNTGHMALGNGSIMPFSGIVDNTGTITLDSTGTPTQLQIIHQGITLQAGGRVRFSDSPGTSSPARAWIRCSPTLTIRFREPGSSVPAN